MKIFIFNVIKFSIFCFLFFISILCINRYFFEDDRFSSQKNIFLLGDSHAMLSLNPSIIENSINLGSKGETLNITYHKIQYLHKNNNIKTLVISLGYHSLSYNFIEERFLNNNHLQKIVDNYYPFLNNDIINELNVDLIRYYTGTANNILLPRISYIFNWFKTPQMKSYPYFDGFKYSEGVNLNEKKLDNKLKGHFCANKPAVSSVAISTLYKLVNFSKKNQIQLIFINTPVHKKYFERIPDNLVKKYLEILDKFDNEPDIYFLDYSNFNLEDDNYLDYDHTNIKGANLISKKLNDFLNKKIN